MTPKTAKKLEQILTQAFFSHQNGQLTEAKNFYAQALKTYPGHFDALHMLGVIHSEEGDTNQAIACIERALKINPKSARAHTNLGNAFKKSGQLQLALKSHQRALDIDPNFAAALNNLSNVLTDLGYIEDAIKAQERILELKPGNAEALNNKAASLLDLNTTKAAEEAANCCTQALEIQPNYVDAIYNLGLALRTLERHEDAIVAFNSIIDAEPLHADSHWSKSVSLEALGRDIEAHACADLAIELAPDKQYRHGARFHGKAKLCNWANFKEDLTEIIKRIENDQKPGEPFGLMATSAHPKILKKSAAQWYENSKQLHIPAQPPSTHEHQKIRVAYFSSDFRQHAVAILTAEMFECQDKARFETYGFAIDKEKSDDPMRQRLKGAFTHFIEAGSMSDREITALAREYEIDIAVDLNGITKGQRPLVFSKRAAPIQASYLGFPGSISNKLFDYIIADPYVIQNGSEDYFHEKIVRLPHTYMVNDTTRKINKRFTRTDLGLPEDSFIFCSFNNSYKITPDVFDVWMRILLKTKNSVLWLAHTKTETKTNLRNEAASRGVSAERLIFASHLESLEDHLGRISMADLFLDCFYYNAHTTAIDALWANLPVLTMPSASFSGRVAGSILGAIGLEDLITDSPANYEETAVHLAHSPKDLDAIRTRLHSNRLSHPLFNTALFTRHFEDALTLMWSRHQQGLPAEHIQVPARTTHTA